MEAIHDFMIDIFDNIFLLFILKDKNLTKKIELLFHDILARNSIEIIKATHLYNSLWRLWEIHDTCKA